MLKIGSKRRRTRAQVIADKEAAKNKDEQLRLHEEQKNVMEEQTQLLRQRVAELEAAASNNQTATDILNNLMAQGIAVQDEDGSIKIPSAEKERRRSK